MSKETVIYETRLSTEGKGGIYVGVFVIAGWIALALNFCVYTDPLRVKLIPALLFLLGLIPLGWTLRRSMRLISNKGHFRISTNEEGLRVQCDDPDSTPSFRIAANELRRLIIRVIHTDAEGGRDLQYFAEEESGKRHQFEDFLMPLEDESVAILRRIAEQFSHVSVDREEVHENPN